MEGGIVILLILVIVAVLGAAAFLLSGAGGLAAWRADRAEGGRRRPAHTRVHDDPDEQRGEAVDRP